MRRSGSVGRGGQPVTAPVCPPRTSHEPGLAVQGILAVVLDDRVTEDHLGGGIAGEGVQQSPVLPLDSQVRACGQAPGLGEESALGCGAAHHACGPAADRAEPRAGDLGVLLDSRVDETLAAGQVQDAVPSSMLPSQDGSGVPWNTVWPSAVATVRSVARNSEQMPNWA